jgi:hypothetical protein
MKSAEFIHRKFQAWAHRRNIMLQGSEGERGQPNYTLSLGENLLYGQEIEIPHLMRIQIILVSSLAVGLSAK